MTLSPLPGFFLILLLSFNFLSLNAQVKEGKIYGFVMDESAEPVINAAVYVNDVFKMATGSDGRYEVSVPILTPINLRIDAFNSSNSFQVEFEHAGERARKDFTFKIELGILDTFAVRRVKRDLAVIEINPKTSVQFPYMQIEEVLAKAAIGVSKTNELSSAYNVRGGNFDENLIYVNDVEVYRPFLARSGQQEGLSFINPDMTNKINFSAGGFESKYGDKLSSVLDVEYNKPKEFGGTVSLSLLGAGIHVQDQPDRSGRFSYVLGVRYRTLQYVLSTLDVAGDYKPKFTDIQALLTYKLNSNWSLNYFTTFAQNSYLVVPESRSTSFGTLQSAVRLFVGFGGSELTEYATFLNAVTMEYHSTDYKNKVKWISSNFNSHEKEHFTIEGAYRLEELENNLGADNFAEARSVLGLGYFVNHARNDLQYNVSSQKIMGSHVLGNHTIEWGTKLQFEHVKDKLREWNYNDSAGYNATRLTHSPNEIVLDDFLATKNNINSYRIMGYVQDRIMISTENNMRLNIGIRSNYWNFNEQNVVSPRMNFSFEPNKRHNDTIRTAHYQAFESSAYNEVHKDSLRQLYQFVDSNTSTYLKRDWVFRFSTGYYYQPPFYRELRNPQGALNATLRAQRSIHFVAGGDLLFKAWTRDFRFVGEVYYKKLDDLVPYTINNVKLRYDAVNSSKGYATGFDARVNGEFIKGLESWLNFSILSTKENITFEDENGVHQTGYIRRPTDQRMNFSILFQDELPMDPSFKMNLNLIAGSALPYYFNGPFRYEERFKLPAYRRVDIGFSKELMAEGSKKTHTYQNYLKSLWMSLEIFNMLQVNNTASYTWIEDLNNNLYGVPNYLTGRRLNLKLIARF